MRRFRGRGFAAEQRRAVDLPVMSTLPEASNVALMAEASAREVAGWEKAPLHHRAAIEEVGGQTPRAGGDQHLPERSRVAVCPTASTSYLVAANARVRVVEPALDSKPTPLVTPRDQDFTARQERRCALARDDHRPAGENPPEPLDAAGSKSPCRRLIRLRPWPRP